MKSIFTKRGQSLTEIALIIGIVGLVLIGMEVYARRGLQGKVKDLTDNLIGKKQSVYQQDTSGLEVNTSQSAVVSGSTTRSGERPAGAQQVLTVEHSTASYTYQSRQALGK